MRLAPSVLLETKSLLVLDKPVNWVINDSLTAHGNDTVQNYIRENFSYPISDRSDLRNGIVHRIDKETSGVLLVAKTESVFYALQKQFFERTVSKEYLTLVHGELRGNGKISAPIGRNPINRKRFTVISSGRDAVTFYEVNKGFKKNLELFTLLTVMPQTGRTHQIRVHLKHINHPIVSDPLYVGRKTLRQDKEWCSRLFLHASKISFIDPETNIMTAVESPLPADLSHALDYIS